MSAATITLRIVGAPKGKQRARFVKATGRTYTPPETNAAEARVREAWRLAGAVDLGNGPLAATLELHVARPASHWRVDGSLTAKGVREWVPVRKPDLDNALKLALDALNGHAYRDDAQVCVIDRMDRRWAASGAREHVVLTLRQCDVPDDVRDAMAALVTKRARTAPSLADAATDSATAELERTEAAA